MGDNPNIGIPTYDQYGCRLIPQKAVYILRKNSAGSAPSKVGGKFFTPSAEAKNNRQKKT